MDTVRQTMREQAAHFYRWLMGQGAARQRQSQEQTTPNGAVRQTLDPDQATLQQHRVGPWRAEGEMAKAQRQFDRDEPRPAPTAPTPSLSAQVGTMQQRLQEHQDALALRQAAAQRRGQEYGR
jgi:hypothetical protein